MTLLIDVHHVENSVDDGRVERPLAIKRPNLPVSSSRKEQNGICGLMNFPRG
jgi:hypothetical protein